MESRPDDLVIHESDVQAVVNAVWAAVSYEGLTGPAVDRHERRAVYRQHLAPAGRTYSLPFVVTAIADPPPSGPSSRSSQVAVFQQGVEDLG